MDHLMRQLMSSLMYFQLILAFFRSVRPFRVILPPQVRLRSSAMCTKLTMNFYIQLKVYSYSLSLLVSCITFSWNSFICFSRSAICSAQSLSAGRQPLLLAFTSGEQTRLIIPLGLSRSFLLLEIELVCLASISSSCAFLALPSSSYFNSRIILSLSSLLRCSCLISSCKTWSMLSSAPRFCGLRG